MQAGGRAQLDSEVWQKKLLLTKQATGRQAPRQVGTRIQIYSSPNDPHRVLQALERFKSSPFAKISQKPINIDRNHTLSELQANVKLTSRAMCLLTLTGVLPSLE